MQTASEDAETRRGLKRSAELPTDDQMLEVRGRGEHLDDDVPIVMTSNAAAKMMNAALTCELPSAEVWTLA